MNRDEFDRRIKEFLGNVDTDWAHGPATNSLEHDCAAWNEGQDCCLEKQYVLDFLWNLAQQVNPS